MYLDKNVCWTLLSTCFVCIVLMSYKSFFKEECSQFFIAAHGLSSKGEIYYEAGEPIHFHSSLTAEKKVEWNFGDKIEPQKTSGNEYIQHTFSKPGDYIIRATLNAVCYAEKRITVTKREVVQKVIIPQIFGPFNITASIHPLKYTTDVVGSSYEWKILDKSDFLPILNDTAEFTFVKPGLYQLQLTIDNDKNKVNVININVKQEEAVIVSDDPNPPLFTPSAPKPKKPEEKPAFGKPGAETQKPTAPESQPKSTPATEAPRKRISDPFFKDMLEYVVEGKTDVQDFDEYLKDKGKTSVNVTISGKTESKIFSDFVGKLKNQGEKNIQIINVMQVRNNDKDVIRIDVYIKVNKGFFGLKHKL